MALNNEVKAIAKVRAAALRNITDDSGNMLTGVFANGLDNLAVLTDIQTEPGNAGSGEYMRGMANGLLLALSCFTGQSPVYIPEGEPTPVADMRLREKGGTDAV